MTVGTVVDDQAGTAGSGTDELESSLRGAVLRPGGDDYDLARRVFNAMIDRRPALIVRCAGVADVVEAVRFARARGLLVAVRAVVTT
jgi:FAD/FMN-containing dehydrogenase